MICKACLEAGAVLKDSPATAAGLHERCVGGTWCDCQHKPYGVNWNLVDIDKDGNPMADPRRGA